MVEGDERTGVVIDIASPFSLHPSDYPSLVLVSPPFDGRSFGEWSRSIKIALSTKNKVGFIDGTIQEPITDPDYQCSERCNDMVISWLIISIGTEICNSVIYTSTTAEIWKQLQARNGQASGAQLFAVQRESSSIVQGTYTIASYYNKKKSLWDELASLRDFPTCSCGGSKKFVEFVEERKLLEFLMGLNETYTTARGKIFMMNSS